MKKCQYKTNVDILLAEGRRIVNTTSDPVFKYRCTLVNMVLSGTPATEIAKSGKEKTFYHIQMGSHRRYRWL